MLDKILSKVKVVYQRIISFLLLFIKLLLGY